MTRSPARLPPSRCDETWKAVRAPADESHQGRGHRNSRTHTDACRPRLARQRREEKKVLGAANHVRPVRRSGLHGGGCCCTNGRRELRLQASGGAGLPFLATKARRTRLIRAKRRDLLPPRSDHARARCCAARLQRDAGKPAVRRRPSLSVRGASWSSSPTSIPSTFSPRGPFHCSSSRPYFAARSHAVGETPCGGRRTWGVLLRPRPPFGILGPWLTSRPPSH